MPTSRLLLRSRWFRAAAAAAVLLVAACSGDDDYSVTIINATGVAILAFPIELESSNLEDPLPSFPVSGDEPNLIEPGDSRRFSAPMISGGFQAGDGLRISIYEVVDSVADYRAGPAFDFEELVDLGFAIEIREDMLGAGTFLSARPPEILNDSALRGRKRKPARRTVGATALPIIGAFTAACL